MYVNYFIYPHLFPDQAEAMIYSSILNINLLFFPLKKLIIEFLVTCTFYHCEKINYTFSLTNTQDKSE